MFRVSEKLPDISSIRGAQLFRTRRACWMTPHNRSAWFFQTKTGREKQIHDVPTITPICPLSFALVVLKSASSAQPCSLFHLQFYLVTKELNEVPVFRLSKKQSDIPKEGHNCSDVQTVASSGVVGGACPLLQRKGGCRSVCLSLCV